VRIAFLLAFNAAFVDDGEDLLESGKRSAARL
jgi:hypothetical protein